MNIFTTEHPLDSVPLWSRKSPGGRASFGRAVLKVALVLCPIFLGILWLAIQGMDNETCEGPDPSWVDPILNGIGFFVTFPALCLSTEDGPLLLQFGFGEELFGYAGVVLDGLFWSCAGVAAYRFVAWRWITRRKCRFARAASRAQAGSADSFS